jgi:hypothetical protein
MKIKNFLTAMLLVLCAAVFVNVQAQDPADDANLDTQLYLIVGTNQEVDDAKLPATLDSVVKQLRSTLPFKNYRLAATLINRVKNEGRLDLSWIGGPLASVSPTGAASNVTPSFSQFKVRQVKLVRNAENQQVVQMLGFNFGARIPIQTPGPIAANGSVAPMIAYENTGVSTDISMRESEPVIVGTLNIGPSGDAIILVVSAKRTQK